jgi:hypothetical protein
VVGFSYIAEGLFHELCHAFHYASGTRKNNKMALNSIYGEQKKYLELWQGIRETDEELYTITGKFHNGTALGFDPVNCNMFNICNSCKTGKPLEQRIFHFTATKLEEWKHEQTVEINLLHNIDMFLIDTSKYLIDIP